MWYLTKIPKIAHFYWGNTILSWLRYMTIKSFSLCNPDWKIQLFIPRQLFSGGYMWEQNAGAQPVTYAKDYMIDVVKIPNLEVITEDFSTNGIGDLPEVFRSDLLRLRLLGTQGGFWSDMDVIHFRPFSGAYFNTLATKEVDTILSYTNKRHHYSIGYMFGCENNAFYKFLYERGLEELKSDGDRQTFGIRLWDKYFKTPNDIKSAYPHLNLFNIELDASYSFIFLQLEQIFNQVHNIPNPRTIALHYYGGHPIACTWEKILTEHNFNQYQSTILNCIKRALAYAH